MMPLRALVAEDSEDDYLLVLAELRGGGFEVMSRRIDGASEMRRALEQEDWDIVLSDYTMPQFTALDALALLHESRQPDLPFVIVSGSIGEESAVAALKAGASHYVMKSSLERLVPVVEHELRDARIRRERREAFVALEEAVRTRDEFLSIASHELKTPLTAVQLQLQGLRDMFRKSAPEVRAGATTMETRLGRALRSTERLGQLIENLLDVSRITTGRMKLNVEGFDLTEAVREVTERIREEIRRAGSDLRLSTGGEIAGRWDRLRIEQVLMNLLSNAIKYGSGKPIEIAVHGGPSAAIIQIVDHGIGISEEDRERIFERFERAVSSRNYGGLGLGLYIARQIIGAHGGSVRAEQTPGGGATFTVELPLAPPHVVAEERAS
jgi:signal transduction histidine kinase